MSEELKNVTATVKWYKADKGFGFVRFADGSGEAFLHSSVIAPLGEVALTEGTVLVCDVAENAKGRQVAAIHAVTPAAPAEPKPRRESKRTRQRGPEAGEPRGNMPGGMVPAAPGAFADDRPRRSMRREQPQVGAGAAADVVTGVLMNGTVRWYNLDSQSGIIDPWDEDSGIGVYFDRATLRRSGLDVVADGEDVRFVAQQGDDGPFAVRVELA